MDLSKQMRGLGGILSFELKGGGIHEDIEWVETESVATLAEILYRTAERFCR
jgi:cystathionine beta-lyase/cystathionine gamma-synthase